MNLKPEADVRADDGVIRTERICIFAFLEPDEADTVRTLRIGHRAESDHPPLFHQPGPVSGVLLHELGLGRSHVRRECGPRWIESVQKVVHRRPACIQATVARVRSYSWRSFDRAASLTRACRARVGSFADRSISHLP